jgi:YVTN family beta-propeller protein
MIKIMKNSFLAILSALMLISCTEKPAVLPPSDVRIGGGLFLLNEGNFNSGNGSISFYSYDSLKIFNNIFFDVNTRPLGDVPNSMAIVGDKAYIVVNNSGKIEVVNSSTMAEVKTITGLVSPRNIAVVNYNKAYVTSLYSDSVAIINLSTNSISGFINLRRSSESIVITNNKAYIANWMGGHEVMVVDVLIDKVSDSINVGIEPESMVIDRYQKLWVLCNGGWQRQNVAELDKIDISSDIVEQQFKFPTIEASPTCLQIDGFGLTLFYLESGVRQMDVNASGLPGSILIAESGAHFYKLAVNPVNSDIFITDPIDYQQNGYLFCYKNDGTFVSKTMAGIIPGGMYFRLIYNTNSL